MRTVPDNLDEFNLFVYGTLMEPLVFHAVLGLTLAIPGSDTTGDDVVMSRRAILNGYRKESPDGAYLYAVPGRHERIRGLLIGPLPKSMLKPLRKYEGRNYHRKKVSVVTASGAEKAVVFIGNVQQFDHSFGHEFRDRLKQEILLDRKIEAALVETELEHLHTTEEYTRQAVRELRGPTIRDLHRQHFEAGGISDYHIRHSLKDAPLRDFSRIANDPKAKILAPNYLALVIRQVIFNQFEEQIRRSLRYQLDQMDLARDYYDRTISSVIALRMLNYSPERLDSIITQCLTELSFPHDELVDFIRWAIIAAEKIYDESAAKRELSFIHRHMGRGRISLGTELEMSNIGHAIINDPQAKTACDARYDGFIYFSDFALDALTWKLGGHIDDHREKISSKPRRGFFELALGNLSIAANISKPVTDDPWLLNQFIHEARRFFDIEPHSVHISLQLRRQHKPDLNRTMPLNVMKCLFAIAGDLCPNDQGRLHIARLANDEIAGHPKEGSHLLFSDVSKRYSQTENESYPGINSGKKGIYVQQFRFLRLSPELNYETIALALKGLQVSLRPGTFLTANQFSESKKHRRLFNDLVAWGQSPSPIGDKGIEKFLHHVHKGLVGERRGKPAHTHAYIAWAIDELRSQLQKFDIKIARSR